MRAAPLAGLVLVVSLSACAPGEITDVHPAPPAGEATVPRGAYVPIRAGRPYSKTTYQKGDGLTVFLNAGGGTYHAGADDPEAGTSSVVASSGRSQVTIPPYGGGAAWEQLVECVGIELAPSAFRVVDSRPTSGRYIEVALGGDGSELNMKGYAGVAPIDTNACLPIDRAVVFVFANKLDGLRGVCEATVAEIGHAASLDHTFACADPMSYLGGCGDRHLQDASLACGELSERPCICGRDKQNPRALLNELVGGAATLPPPAIDPCAGVTYAGTCSADGKLTYCHADTELRTLDCAGHQLGCGDTGDPEIGNDCVPKADPPPTTDACMGIDFLGQCSDAGVLSYCLDGALETIDCAAIGQECTYVDDTVGYFCTNPPAPDECGAVDFFGQCSDDGSVLTYCLDGSLRVIDCGAQGLVCGFIDENTGNGCIEPPPPATPSGT
jgi:hypothetical protein